MLTAAVADLAARRGERRGRRMPAPAARARGRRGPARRRAHRVLRRRRRLRDRARCSRSGSARRSGRAVAHVARDHQRSPGSPRSRATCVAGARPDLATTAELAVSTGVGALIGTLVAERAPQRAAAAARSRSSSPRSRSRCWSTCSCSAARPQTDRLSAASRARSSSRSRSRSRPVERSQLPPPLAGAGERLAGWGAVIGFARQ